MEEKSIKKRDADVSPLGLSLLSLLGLKQSVGCCQSLGNSRREEAVSSL